MKQSPPSLDIFREVTNLQNSHYHMLRVAMRHEFPDIASSTHDRIRFQRAKPPRLTLISPAELVRFHHNMSLPWSEPERDDLAMYLDDTLPEDVDELTEVTLEPTVVRETGLKEARLQVAVHEDVLATRGLIQRSIYDRYGVASNEAAWNDGDGLPDAGIALGHIVNDVTARDTLVSLEALLDHGSHNLTGKL